MIEVVQLKAKHYDQIVSLLNEVFSAKNNKKMDFEKMLPAFFVRDDKRMNAHYGIFDGEKLVAVAGAYPVEVVIGDKTLHFTTLGNVATRPEYTGRGYMSLILSHIEKEAKRIGVVASVLGGSRHRYNRFGYEPSGMLYTFSFTELDRTHVYKNFTSNIVFEKVEKDNLSAIRDLYAVYQQSIVSTNRASDRGDQGVYDILSAWDSIPYVAVKDGKVIGYLTLASNGEELSEICAASTPMFMEMLCAWQIKTAKNVIFKLPAFEVETVRECLRVCTYHHIGVSGSFAVWDWAVLTKTLLEFKRQYASLPYGELRIAIEEYGTLYLSVSNDGVQARKTEEEAMFTLNRLEAVRFFFGTLPSFYVKDASPLASAWFPLPLSFRLLDRG